MVLVFIKIKKVVNIGKAADGSGSVERKRPQCALWWAVVYSTTESRLSEELWVLRTVNEVGP